MGPAKMGDLRGAPALKAIAPRERFEHPGVDGKRLGPAGAEEQHAIGDLFPHARQFEQARFRCRVRQIFGFLQPARTGREVNGGLVNESGAKAEQAIADLGSRPVEYGGLDMPVVPTESPLLAQWESESESFRKVMPEDYRRVLGVLREAEARGVTEVERDEMIMASAHG